MIVLVEWAQSNSSESFWPLAFFAASRFEVSGVEWSGVTSNPTDHTVITSNDEEVRNERETTPNRTE